MDRFPLLGLVVTDEWGLITGWAPGAERLLGHTAAQAAGKPVAELLELEGFDSPRERQECHERHTVRPVRRRDGSVVRLPVSRYPLGSDDGPGDPHGLGDGGPGGGGPGGGGPGGGGPGGGGPGGGGSGAGGAASVLVIGPPPDGVTIQEKEALAGLVLEASPTALAVYDTDLRCAWQSDRMRRLTGISDEQWHARRPADVLNGPDAVEWERWMRLALLTGEEQVGEIKGGVLTESASRVFSVSAIPLRDGQGQTIGVCTTMTDVTEASRGRERLALLNDASVRIGSTLDLTRTAQELTEVTVPRLADFARVDLLEVLLRGDEPAPGPIVGAVRLRRIAEMSLFEGITETRTTADDADVYLASSPAALCLASGRSAMYRTTDPVVRSWVQESASRTARISRHGVHSWILVPVKARGTTLGVVMLARTRDTPEPFEPDDLSLAQDLVARAAVCLDNSRRYTRERTAALALQRSLLPRSLPSHSAVQVASRYLPASASTGVGGDWFDVIRLSGARVALVVGDVVGHGIHAAAAMGRLRTAVRTLADIDPAPDELLTRLDDLVMQLATESGDDPEISDPEISELEIGALGADIGATCLYAVYDPVSGCCSLARAGHPAPAVVWPDGSADFLNVPAGPPLGLGGFPFESVERKLPPDSLLALFTDGLVESRHRDLDVGLERLLSSLTRPADSLEDVCDHVVRKQLPDGPADDAALLLVRTRVLDTERVAVWEVPKDAAAVADVRADSVRRLESWGLEEAAFVTELVVSELVTNAIRYGEPPVQLRLVHDETLICEVSDASSTAPHMRRARVWDEGGRGLPLVAQLTQRWGTRQTSVGKTIWCEQGLPSTTVRDNHPEPAATR